MKTLMAAEAGLLLCSACHLLQRPNREGDDLLCARCGGSLHLRKPGSTTRAWTFLLAACSLYIPANILPVMETGSLFGSQTDTIMSGVIYLWTSGSGPLAAIIFIASIVVPASKVAALAFLLLSVQRRSTWKPVERTRLFRLVELVGRWSMVDIYVAALLTALVHFQSLATIRAGPGAIAFGAVVVLTMFAAEAFDPRLIWDPLRRTHASRAT
jgi:paraquat-inducible protein A